MALLNFRRFGNVSDFHRLKYCQVKNEKNVKPYTVETF